VFTVDWREQPPLPPAHTAVASPEPPRSTSNPGLEVLRGGSGVARGRVRCRVGAIGRWMFGVGRSLPIPLAISLLGRRDPECVIFTHPPHVH
jgi:hypothetical protein